MAILLHKMFLRCGLVKFKIFDFVNQFLSVFRQRDHVTRDLEIHFL